MIESGNRSNRAADIHRRFAAGGRPACRGWNHAITGRRAFLAAVGGALCISRLAAAQPANKLHRLGFLHLTPDPARMEAFRSGLGELGYVEGQHLAILDRLAEGHVHRLRELAAELVRLNVDVIVTGGSITTHAAKQATTAIPIVMAADDSPIEDGFVASLGRPGGNITGLITLSRQLNGKRLALLKEATPRVTRVLVLLNPANRAAGPAMRATEAAAKTMGLHLEAIEVRGPDEFEGAFAAAGKARTQALILGHQDPIFHNHARQLVSLATRNRLPAVFYLKDFAEHGGLMAYAPSYPDLFRRAATYVDKILKGAKPGDLPVEQPTKFELVINLKTARSLGVTVPPALLQRADKIIG